MGDYTNLSVRLELDLTDPVLPGIPCRELDSIPDDLPLGDILDLPNLCDEANAAIQQCIQQRTAAACAGLPLGVVNAVCQRVPVPGLCPAGGRRWRRPAQPAQPPEPARPRQRGGGMLGGGLGGLLRPPAFGSGDTTRTDASGAGRGPTMAEMMADLRPGAREPPRPAGGGAAVITRRTKIQLVIFVIITLVGASRSSVPATRASTGSSVTTPTPSSPTSRSPVASSGNAEVTYRGVSVGEVEKLVLTDEGVDVHIGIENTWDAIPSDSVALVGNKSAVGEQYVELQPQSDVDDTDSYLSSGSEIDVDDTAHPVVDRRAADQPVQHGRLGRQRGPAHDRLRARPGVRRHRREPPAAHRQRQLLHRGRQRQLRHHHHPDPRRQHRAQRSGGLGVRAAHLRPRPVPLQHRAGQRRRRPAHGHRQRVLHRHPAAHVHRGQPGPARPADPQPHDHGGGAGQAAPGDQAGAGDLPLRRRGRASPWSRRRPRPASTTRTSA